MYTMKIQLLTNVQQYDQLTDVTKRFSQVCNHISEVGFLTKTYRSKVRLSKECYHQVRDIYSLPAQMVVRAVGKVVEAYREGIGSKVIFEELTSVVYDTRLIKFKWMQSVSIATFTGRIEVPFKVTGYRRGSYDRRVSGLADLILENGVFFLLLVVDMPEEPSIKTLEFVNVVS
ncbi:hypothetical protein BK120_23170 [Paenibacillus sp. FSL A5-0031]|uniref:hypothetical protein n=1 Tax=Paenibacillus sp. FSL A5-0031 TaxID=1920420 RepID=UPI00097AF059|nr:hypothetical protein [Paenibacillus sp. FSL A5-0031]OME78643.1 hypothetical protein BK120_23170 [Paenibacillus sp. FSL A5-0031]